MRFMESVMRILFAEDDDPKSQNIESFLVGRDTNFSMQKVKSVRSTIDALRVAIPELVLLDMSLPTFDIGRPEPGGRPQSAGGISVLDHMQHAEIVVPTIIITQHEAFDYEGSTISLSALLKTLSVKYSDCFAGLVRYNTITGQWRNDLANVLSNCFGSIRA